MLLLEVYQGDTLRLIDKIALSSEKVDSASISNHLFLDVQRYTLAPGDYRLDLSYQDRHDPVNNDTLFLSHKLMIPDYSNGVDVSEALFVERTEESKGKGMLNRGDVDQFPYVSRFFNKTEDTLRFYHEVYGLDSAEDSIFLARTTIVNYENNKLLKRYSSLKRCSNKEIEGVTGAFILYELPTGNYILKTEIINRKNEVLATSKTFFQRYKREEMSDLTRITYERIKLSIFSRYTAEDLKWYMRSLHPISNTTQVLYAKNLTKNDTVDTTLLIGYMINFWESRDQFDPESSWLKYKLEVDKVNQAFASRISPGFETERGRIYLKYGPPNNINSSMSETGAWPYEIWHFYELEDQRNVRFVFYNPTLVKNEFELIHSEAFGEILNPQWRKLIYSRSGAGSRSDNNFPGNYNINSKLEQNYGG